MSRDIIEVHGIQITAYAGPERMRMFQINFDGKYIALDIVNTLRLRNILSAMCFCNPPHESGFHTVPELLDNA